MKLNTLDEVCEFQSGLWTGKKGPFKDVKVLRNTNFTKDNKLNLEDIAEIKAEEKQLDKRMLKNGDILIEKSGGGPNQPVGRIVFIDERAIGFSFSNFTSRIRVSTDDLDPKYLYWFLNYIYLSGKTENLQRRSTGIRNLQLKEYKKIVIPVPSLQEQEKIVERLDKVFDKIQHIENKHTTEVNFINNFKKSFIKNKFDNNTYEFQKLEEIFEITSSKRVFKSEWTNSGIPFLRARELVKLANNLEFKDPIFISESHYEKIKNKYGVPKNGDILITGVGTLGITYLVDDEEKFYFKDGNIIWLKSLNKVNSEFIKLYIDSPDIQTKINNKIGATVKTFTISDANKLEVPVPPKKIQDKLINEIKNFNILLNNFKELNSMKIKKLSLLKKSILNKEFSYE